MTCWWCYLAAKDLTDFLTSKGENGPSAEEAVQEMREKVKMRMLVGMEVR